MKLPICGAIASILVLFLAFFLARGGYLVDPLTVVLAGLGALGFAGCTVWAGIRSLRRAKN
ncbi:hypothetical protein [Cryobacterium arcticum]|uniref:Uncharacterized protein n=1 Tax=Cryobacterium arcticum TaxID=670052 RepID=A0A317ZPC3_9MICO|nr:hypothetical protein [Cryobacterium arcticum]PXA68352.1 hypothetical protein CTB96_17200 [Cryobacterium arcticum]